MSDSTKSNPNNGVARWIFVPIVLASLLVAWFGYRNIYLRRVAASYVGNDVFYAGGPQGVIPECGPDGRFAGLKAAAETGPAGAVIDRGTPLLVIRNQPDSADWFLVRTRDGQEGFVHRACVFRSAEMACANPRGVDGFCWARTGLPPRQ